jgi:hypothetical protein
LNGEGWCAYRAADGRRQYRHEGIVCRKTATITFDTDVPSGATAWVSAAWISRRGKTSPACNPVRVTIQGGPVLATAV